MMEWLIVVVGETFTARILSIQCVATVCTNIHSGDDFQKFINVLSKEQAHLVPVLLTDGGEML